MNDRYLMIIGTLPEQFDNRYVSITYRITAADNDIRLTPTALHVRKTPEKLEELADRLGHDTIRLQGTPAFRRANIDHKIDLSNLAYGRILEYLIQTRHATPKTPITPTINQATLPDYVLN